MIRISRREFVRLVRQAYLHIPPAISQTLRNVDVVVEEWPSAEELEGLPDDTVVVAYCRGPHCVYALDAVRALNATGRRARRLDGGFPECRRDGLPTTSPTTSQTTSQTKAL